MFIPSLIFSILEEWTMIDAFYFTFITLSTIGFGDYIAGYGEPMSYSDIYKIAIVIWIMIALGYWIFLLNFLQKAIKSNAKTLKKTFKTKNISKQAEFLKQMITKGYDEVVCPVGENGEKLTAAFLFKRIPVNIGIRLQELLLNCQNIFKIPLKDFYVRSSELVYEIYMKKEKYSLNMTITSRNTFIII
ncbi:Open rectifier potassium channel protein 1 [Armadillidium vulgare]|nr:Open rectifier potassium channel protein 1 [Armadillidium vulgare]